MKTKICNVDSLKRYDTASPDSIYYTQPVVSFPMFVSLTFGSDRFYTATVVKDAFKENKKTYVTLSKPFYVGDEIRAVELDSSAWVVNNVKRRGRSEYLYEISLENGTNVVSLHLDELKKDKRVQLVGRVGSKSKF